MKESVRKRNKKSRSCNIYYAFPVLVAVMVGFLFSQELFSQFIRTPNSSNSKKEAQDLIKSNEFSDPDDLFAKSETKEMSLFSKREARENYLMYLNETTARINYKKRFTAEEKPYKDKILGIEDLIEVKSDYGQATRELKDLAYIIPNSPRFLYASALLIDSISIFERSNNKLNKCIMIYKKIIAIENIDKNLLYISGKRLINRLQFLGKNRDAIIQSETLTLKIPQNLNLLNDFGISLLMYNKPKLAKERFEQVLTFDNQDPVALCHYGFILKTTDNKLKESIEYFTKCLASKHKSVMDNRFFYHLGDALQRLGRTEEAYNFYQIAVEYGLFPSVYQRSLINEPNLKAKPWWSLKETTYEDDLKVLEENWKLIRKEALAQMNRKTGAFITDQEKLTEKGDWKQFNLYISGTKIEENCEKTPFTCYLIDQMYSARTCRRGQVKFSLMSPGTHIIPHCGPSNCRLRAHLGLKIPSELSIRVGNEYRKWNDGKVIVFDDSFEHEVWHNGTEFRLVLIVDFWHPDLSITQREQLSPL